MDTKQLITIAVTVLLTTLAKTLIEALTRWVKILLFRAADRVKTKVTPTLDKIGKSTEAVFGLLMLGYLSPALIHFVKDPAPLTRLAVFAMAALTSIWLYWFANTTRAIGAALRRSAP